MTCPVSLDRTEMNKLTMVKALNTGSERYIKYGSMLEKTKKALDEFYQPFITKLAEILQDKRFLWLNTPH